MDELNRYIEHIDALVNQLRPDERMKLTRQIGAKIRQSNQRRIMNNLQPDGNPMHRRKGNKDFLNGYRKLRANEKMTVGRIFIYDGPEMRHNNVGELRQMVSIKTPETDKKYGHQWRKHKGGVRYQRTNYDPDYIQGYALSPNQIAKDGVAKFNRKHIYVVGKGAASQAKQKLMFRKINQYKYLKMKATSHEAAIGFLTGLTGYIAAAHHYGEDNRPQRELLGISDDDMMLIKQMLLDYFAMRK